MRQTTLLGNKELADLLGWNEQKTHTYYMRGKFETPAYMVGNRPAWTQEQAERIAWAYKDKERDGE